MVDTDDTRQMMDDARRTIPGVWHKLPTGELIKDFIYYLYVRVHMIPIFSGPNMHDPNLRRSEFIRNQSGCTRNQPTNQPSMECHFE